MRRLLLALLLAPAPLLAQNASLLSPNTNARLPQCGPGMDGQAMCRFGVIYECEFISPNSIERRTGWRWKPDLLRACDTTPEPSDLPRPADQFRPGDQFRDTETGLPPGFTYAPQTNDNGTQSNQPGMQPTPGFRRSGRHY